MSIQPKYRPNLPNQQRRQLILGIISIGLSIPLKRISAADEAPRFDLPTREIIAKLPAVGNAMAIPHGALMNKPVLITFFASWCPPCRAEFKHLNKLHQQIGDSQLQILAINVHEQWDDDDKPRMAKFLETTRPSFPVVKGSEEIRNLFGGINRIPTVYGFDAPGNLQFDFIHRSGATKTNATYEELSGIAQQLIHQNP